MPHAISSKKVFLLGGLDPTGHAGVLRDFEACLRFETPSLTIVTALTAQNDRRFLGFAPVDLKFCETTWKSFDTTQIAAVKIGMLGHDKTVKWIVKKLSALKKQNTNLKIVWDPVFSSSSGTALLTKTARQVALKQLLPLVDILTPNAEEACQILGVAFSKNLNGQNLAQKLKESVPAPVAVYLKGGHLKNKTRDWLVTDTERYEFQGRASKKKLRGTGCLLATAVACGLQAGLPVIAACEQAKEFLDEMFSEIENH